LFQKLIVIGWRQEVIIMILCYYALILIDSSSFEVTSNEISSFKVISFEDSSFEILFNKICRLHPNYVKRLKKDWYKSKKIYSSPTRGLQVVGQMHFCGL
jgi:hypothetical protein